MLLGTATVPLDSAVNVAFPHITAHFGVPIAAIQWVVISYTLASASLVLVFGRVGDIVGHRRIFLLGAAWSAIAFLLETAAPDYAWLLAGRVLQGVGAGLVLACGPALVTGLYPDALRPRAVALYTIAFGIGGALGPVLGGALLARFDWSCVFWARAPLALVGLALGLRLPADERAEPEATVRFDWAGAALLVASLGTLLLALGTLRHPLRAAGAAVAAVLIAALFVRREGRTPSPIVKLALFRDPHFALLNLGSILINLAGFSVLLLVPFALASRPGLPEAVRGMILAASPAAVALAAPIAGRALGRGHRWPLSGGALLAAAGLSGIGLVGTGSRGEWIPALVAAMLVQGIGVGAFQVAYLDRVTATLARADRGVAGSLAMLTRTLGIVFGAAFLMLVFQNTGFSATFLIASLLPCLLAATWWVTR